MLAMDHLVIVSTNPEIDAKQFAEEYGVTILEGGKHEKWGTYNYLAFFQNNSYIEWLGVFDEKMARKSENPLIKETMDSLDKGITGLLTFALRTNAMDKHLNSFDKNNIHYDGPYPGARKKVDGSILSWRMSFPSQEEPLPFLIEWGTGVNLPADETKINSNVIDTVKVPENPAVNQDVFQLKCEGNTVELENGQLLFSTNSPLEFILR